MTAIDVLITVYSTSLATIAGWAWFKTIRQVNREYLGK